MAAEPQVGAGGHAHVGAHYIECQRPRRVGEHHAGQEGSLAAALVSRKICDTLRCKLRPARYPGEHGGQVGLRGEHCRGKPPCQRGAGHLAIALGHGVAPVSAGGVVCLALWRYVGVGILDEIPVGKEFLLQLGIKAVDQIQIRQMSHQPDILR